MAIVYPGIPILTQGFYKLRWRFDFLDHKPTKRGIWNHSTRNHSDSAWIIDKKNLAQAMVEVEAPSGHEYIALIVDGPDYVSFEWDVAVHAPTFLNPKCGSGYELTRIYVDGLSILTRTHKVQVNHKGLILPKLLTEHDKRFELREHAI